jgi:DHA2 family multidrug resistance protein-like MFS transporter
MTLVVLDAGVANVAAPAIGDALGVSAASAVLVITAYQAAIVMALLPCGALGERFGHRRVFLVGVALFTIASALCAAFTSLFWLVAARFLQGLGGAAIMALGVALLRLSVGPKRLGAAISWNALTVALTSAAAPSIGALIVGHADWPWLFVVNLPLGVLAFAAGRGLPTSGKATHPLDPLSMLLNAAVFGLLVVGAEFLPTSPWSAVVLLILAGGGLAVLLRREAPKASPLIPFDLLRQRSFRVSVIASVCCFVGQTAGMVALPFYLIQELGQTALVAGAYLTAWPLSVALMATVTGRLADRLSTAILCAAGGGLLALGLALAALWPLQGDPRPLALFAMLCGAGFGLFNVPNNRAMFLSAPPARSGAAGGMQGTARLTGQTAGAVLMTLLFSLFPMALAPRLGLAIGAVFAATAGLISVWRQRDTDAGA